MYRHRSFKKLLVSSAGFFLLFLILGCPLFASDTSRDSATYNTADNCNEGWYEGDPRQDNWMGFDMIYYKEKIWEGFFRPFDWWHPNNNVTIYIYSHGVTEAPVSCPSHIKILEGGQTYSNTTTRHSAIRFAVFRDKLYLYDAKAYDGTDYKSNTGFKLWERVYDDATNTFTQAGAKLLWEKRPKDPDNPAPIRGLVVKVMNDKLYLLIQAKSTHDLYLITYDGTTYSSPQKIYTLPGNDCILNGDVFMRGSDSQPVLAFLTKDDALDGSITGLSKIYVFDPADNSVTYVTDFPNKYKDLAIVQGNVLNCKPYSANSFQIWGVPWESDTLQHMQFVFNDDGKTGAFNPTGRVYAVNVSKWVDDVYRGYVAACSAPEQVQDTNGVSLQSYDWVWWFSSTGKNAYGQSLKYKADYLKNLGPAGDYPPNEGTDPTVNYVNDAWVLLGVLTGLPPYYPNAIDQEWLGDYYKVSYGNEYQLEVSTSVTSEKSVSIGYQKEFRRGKASMGFSYSNAVEDKTGKTRETSAKETLEFNPAYITPGPIENGAQAWGIFLAPYIMSDRYELYSPDKATDFGITLYYTYIGDNSSIVSQVFDMTNPSNPVNDPFFHGFPTLPNSRDYELWKDGGPVIVESGTTDYDTLLVKEILCNNCSQDFEFNQTESVENEQKDTNTISFSHDGRYGFDREMEGSLTMASSNKTSLGQNITVHYGVPGFEEKEPPPADYGRYLTYMDMYMYLLNAKTPNAFWIPEGAKSTTRQQYPWCLTWDVTAYKNMGMFTLQAGGPDTIGKALQSNPGLRNAEIQINTPVIENEEIVLADISLTVKGAASTLDRHGNPTITVTADGLTVEDGAYLHLENLIINGGSSAPVIVNRGGLSIKNCRIVGDEGADGIVQDGGTLFMNSTDLLKSGGDGLRVNKGYASLVNCALTGNSGNGIRNVNGTVILEHCGLLQNGAFDFNSRASARSTASNTVLGSISPGSKISWLLNCLVENLPESAVIENRENCIVNKKSGYVVQDGQLVGIEPNSRCVDAGAVLTHVDYDMEGKYRWQRPDIGPLEYSKPMDIKSIDALQLRTVMEAHPQIATDSLQLVLNIQVPPDFKFINGDRYAISFGNRLITSDQFNRSSKTGHGLKFSMDSNDSYLQMDLSPNQKQLKMILNLSDAQLYQDISRYVLSSRDKLSNSTSTVYMPIRVSAGNFQTGEVWMSFTFSGQNGVGTGSAPQLRPIQ